MTNAKKPILDERQAAKLAKREETDAKTLGELADRFIKVDRILAKRATAPPELLEELSHSSDKITRKNVTGNPNCPKDILLHLAPQFPIEFMANPLFDWLLIEDPTSFNNLGEKVLVQILKHKNCPESFMSWAAENGDNKMKLSVAMNKQAPEAALQKLACDDDPGVSEAARYHEKVWQSDGPLQLEDEFLNAVKDMLKSPDIEDYGTLAQFPYLSRGRQLAELGEYGGAFIVANYIARTDVSPSVLEIAADINHQRPYMGRDEPVEEYPVLMEIFNHPRCQADLLEKLARHWRPLVRRVVASNPNCPVVLLDELATDKEDGVRKGVAANPNCPAELLERLAADEAWWVRGAVAANPNCPTEVLESLTEDAKWVAAENPNCPEELLEKFAADKDETVRRYVAGNPSCPARVLEALAGDKVEDIRKAVAGNPNSPFSVLEKLADDEDGTFCVAVAENPACPFEFYVTFIERLAKDKKTFDTSDPSFVSKFQFLVSDIVSCDAPLELTAEDYDWVLNALAGHPFCPDDLVETIANRHFFDYLGMVVGSPDLESSGSAIEKRGEMVLHYLTSGWYKKDWDLAAALAGTPTETLERLALEDEASLRKALVSNPRFWPELVTKWRASKKPTLRKRLAALPLGNSDKARKVFEKLAADGSFLVRKELANNRDCPDDIFLKLADDEDERVRKTARSNLGHPAVVSTFFVDPVNSPWFSWQGGDGSKLRAAIQKGDVLYCHGWPDIKSKSPVVRILALSNTDKMPDLARASGSPVWLQRMAVARNSATPLNILNKLAKDSNYLVALQAKATLDQLGQLNSEREAVIAKAGKKQLEVDYSQVFDWIAERVGHYGSGSGRFYASPWESFLSLEAMWDPEILPPSSLERMWTEKEMQAFVDSAPADYIATNQEWGPSARMLAMLEKKDPSENLTLMQLGEKGASIELLEALAGEKETEFGAEITGSPERALELLVKLSASSAKCIRVLVAGDPRCPPDVMTRLASDKAENVRKVVATSLRCPVELLEVLAADKKKEVRLAVAENPSSSLAVLGILAKDKTTSGVREKVIDHPNCSQRLESEIRKSQAEDKNDSIRLAAAVNQGFPVDLLAKLAGDKKLEVRLALTENPSCPVEALEKLAGDKSWEVRLAVATNPLSSVEVLQKLAKDKTLKGIREKIIDHPNCKPELAKKIFEQLARHKDSGVRNAVAEHPQCSVELLEMLAGDEWDAVRRDVAEHPTCTVELLDRLAGDDSSWVLESVAKHMNCSADVLKKLAVHESDHVRMNVAENPDCPVEALWALADDPSEWVRGWAARNPKCPAEILERLAGDTDLSVRQAVASNPNCHAGLMKLLAADAEVRRSVASNLSCPVELMEMLAEDKEEFVRWEVVQNPNCPVELWDELCEKLKAGSSLQVRYYVARNWSCPGKLMEMLAADKERGVRMVVAANPNCPIGVLEMLAADKEEGVRLAVAENPDCPIGVLEKLAADRYPLVRRTAASNPNRSVDLLDRLAGASDSEVRDEVANNPNRHANGPVEHAGEPEENTERCLSYEVFGSRRRPVHLPTDEFGYRKACEGIDPAFSQVTDKYSQQVWAKVLRDLRQASSDSATDVSGDPRDVEALLEGAKASIKQFQPELLLQRARGERPASRPASEDDFLDAFDHLSILSHDASNNHIRYCAKSEDSLSRMAAAMHPNTTKVILKSLMDDSEECIRQQATARLAAM